MVKDGASKSIDTVAPAITSNTSDSGGNRDSLAHGSWLLDATKFFVRNLVLVVVEYKLKRLGRSRWTEAYYWFIYDNYIGIVWRK